MPAGDGNRLLHHIRRAALRATAEHRTDGQLLEQFLRGRDEAAFAALVRRHGPMVWGVCRRVLGDAHDADDAFQATFLVLVRRAASVRPREAVGNFLYGVAYRTALEARARRARRRAREAPLRDVPRPEGDSALPNELRPLLDRELSRLADKYRLPVVLCDLEGRSRKEVAQQLAIPEGTLSSRLATARKKLARRLARYGFVVPIAGLTSLLAQGAAPAAAPVPLLAATTRSAVLVATRPAAAGAVPAAVTTLTEGVMKTMFVAKLKTAMVLVVGVAALGLGTGGVYYQTRAGAADTPREGAARAERPTAADPEAEKWKKIAEQAQDRERALRAEVEMLRQQLRQLVEEQKQAQRRAEDQRLQAEEQSRRAEEELRKAAVTLGRRVAEELEEAPQRSAEQLLRPNEGALSEEQRRGKLQRVLSTVEQKRRELREKYEAERKAMDERLRLELEVLHLQENQARSRWGTPPPAINPAHASGDKLDQILQRLDRLENRLDRLERGSGKPPGP